ncbi:M20/M25/M40 family metallo-hydrolase [Thermomicrobiaceae bacterium CFH 74404]|uniref:M20/M25/M40 family metallo-hydrolase n=1 Tax=Thermalbibacter longus TaxID=2951981 RepID=A0AA41WB65_9BACT|nr:M20/M25/M40 family metallo-hydrolase [Thermalbibacter longus]MCM8748357.1 M20/M25/M40 family metallo-hydrolase [Thermalbibacter longus]
MQGRQDDRLGSLIQEHLPRIVDLTARICAIPAPTFHEAERARFMAEQFRQRGLAVEVDSLDNVVARRPGEGRAPALLLAAHLDTVFPPETPISVEHGEGWLQGPGIGDNSLGLAALLTLVDLLQAAGARTPGDLLLAANVGEEGLGNLRGIRALVERYGPELGAVIAVEGHNLGRVTHIAVGSLRLRLTVTGPGGHSWGAFGQPSAIHVLASIVTELTRLPVPKEPKTTYNVGLIEGGVSVNTIAPSASAVIDLRSIDPAELARLSQSLAGIVERHRVDGVEIAEEVLGERPAGQTPVEAPLVQAAIGVLRELGLEPALDASSTDANIPIAHGIPAVCVGLTRGRGSHTLQERIEIEPIRLGLAQLVRLVQQFPVGAGPAPSPERSA